MTRTERQIEAHRKGAAVVRVLDRRGRPRVGVPVWVEQESHEFSFACVIGDLSTFSADDRERYELRLREVFNRVYRARRDVPPEPDVCAVEVNQRVHLGSLRWTLDRVALAGMKADVSLSGGSLGMAPEPAEAGPPRFSERDAGDRLIELYTLAFSHPACRQIVWTGFSDRDADFPGSGLLGPDLSPRRAHKLLRKLIGTVWRTRAAGETDACGEFRFRGFFGSYRVVVASAESTALVATLCLGQATESPAALIVESP